LNGYKISGATVLGRESDENIRSIFTGHGYEPIFVEGHEPALVHQAIAKALEYALGRIRAIQHEARTAGRCDHRPRWPLIVMRTPKGWTGPKEVDGKKVEGTFRSHQVPLSTVRENPEHLVLLEKWLRSYKPEELFTKDGDLMSELKALHPKGFKRMSAQPYTNGGSRSKPLVIPPLDALALHVSKPAADERVSSMAQLGALTRELYKANPHNWRFFSPDEANSNKFTQVFEVSKRAWMLPVEKSDDALGSDGRVMEVLSEHNVNGWMEGYTLTGRHGLLATYEAFAQVFVSMTMQFIKW
jgi:xylulose-5-phosphate/fructose-6-phosphate phosphoketolase